MSELKSYNSERIYWAVEQHEREAGDIEGLHLDDNLFYIKSEVDKMIKDIVKGASSMFRAFKCCRGLDTKSPLGKIADVAYKHWMRDWITENENEQLKDEKDRLLYSNRQLLDRTFQLKKHVISQDRRIRRQKYKRCLAIAKWCRSRACFYDTMRENNLYWGMKSDRAYKWHKRWLKIAEKFKETK